MAANYWDSSQRKHWTFTKKELADMRKNLENEHQTLVSQYPLPDRRLLNIYFCYRLSFFPISSRVRAKLTTIFKARWASSDAA
jgi:cyclin C